MFDLETKKNKGVLLDRSTQIDIAQLLEEGYTYEQIDTLLVVPKGSSEYTIKYVRGEIKNGS